MSRRSKKKAASLPDIESVLGPVKIPDQDRHTFEAAIENPGRPAVRVHPNVKPNALDFLLDPVDWSNRGFWTDPQVRASRRIEYATVDYYIQDAGSLLAVTACDVQPGMNICDLCAAPGGKASSLAEGLGESGWLLANEPVRSRVPALIYNLSRTGSSRWAVSSMDPEVLCERCPGTFDLVLVDAPCSGQSLVGRKRQSYASFTNKQIQHSTARQQRILRSAMRLLRPGGHLVYSTCTFAYQENEAQARWLEKEYPVDFAPLEFLQPFASPQHPGCYRLWPHLHQCAGAFAMRVESRYESDSNRSDDANRRRFQELPSSGASVKFWGALPDHLILGDQAVRVGWPGDVPDWLVNVAVGGPEVSHHVGSTWLPSHALALRWQTSWQPMQTVCLDEDDARQFVTGATVATDAVGWAVVQYNGRPMGWGKGTQGTLKNQLPKHARFQS